MNIDTASRALTFHAFFRELFKTFLGDFLRIAEPDVFPQCLPEEARFRALNLSNWNDADRASLGSVADVPTREGRCATVLIHTEPAALHPTETSRRLNQYLLGLEARYAQPVLLTAVWLRGGRPGINFESVPLDSTLSGVRVFYTAFGLELCRAEHYLERPEPLAWALSALMQPIRRSSSAHRQACLCRIAGAGLPDLKTALLRSCVEEWAPATRGGSTV